MCSFCFCLFRILNQSTKQASTSSDTSGMVIAKMRAVDDPTCGTWSPEAFLLLADVTVGRGLPEHVMSWTIEKDVFDVDSAGAIAKSPPLSSGVVGGLRGSCH